MSICKQTGKNSIYIDAICILSQLNYAKKKLERFKPPNYTGNITYLINKQNLEPIIFALTNFQFVTKDFCLEYIKIRSKEVMENPEKKFGLLNLSSMWTEKWIKIYSKSIHKNLEKTKKESTQNTLHPKKFTEKNINLDYDLISQLKHADHIKKLESTNFEFYQILLKLCNSLEKTK